MHRCIIASVRLHDSCQGCCAMHSVWLRSSGPRVTLWLLWVTTGGGLGGWR